MEIKIDTKKDSIEDIKKVITMLSSLISSSGGSNNIFSDDTTPTESPGVMNMFGDESTLSSDSEETPVEVEDKQEGVEIIDFD